MSLVQQNLAPSPLKRIQPPPSWICYHKWYSVDLSPLLLTIGAHRRQNMMA